MCHRNCSMTSRVIVKNLPSWITEQKLRDVFIEKGCITDCSLKYNASGKSRRFAFVGFSTPAEAESAINYFHNSCIGTSRVKVEACKKLSESTKNADVKNVVTKPKQRSVIPEDLSSDPKFEEFIRLHQGSQNVWGNDLATANPLQLPNEASKSTTTPAVTNHDSETQPKQFENDNFVSDAYDSLVKLKNLPFNVSKDQIKQFFCGLDVKRIVIGSKKRKHGDNSSAYVEFLDSKSIEQAIRRNKSFLGGKKVLVIKACRENNKPINKDVPKGLAKPAFPIRDAAAIATDLSDSGRIFVRNLSYLCCEEDLQELFSKFGELSEVYLPLEKLTKRNKGFAFVSFLMPEHAVRALNELDGSCFQGRMLHILPAEGKSETETGSGAMNENTQSSFKTAKEAALKKSASSSHNWNALFVGTNAVAENLSSEYGAEKKQLFEQSGAAVRMALGETEVVLKTKKFLEDHGVSLEAFGKPVIKRSKSIIIIKNLPAQTRVEELKTLFEKFGAIARLVLPPSGVTGLVEFADSNEARSAFKSLAYRRFKELPLYLEWAPTDTFAENAPLLTDLQAAEVLAVDAEKKAVAPELSSSSDQINSSTLFVKNINFKTTEEELADVFRDKFPGRVIRATIAKNKDSHRHVKSLGYGFVEFADLAAAKESLKQLQHFELSGHKLELKISTSKAAPEINKNQNNNNQKSSAKACNEPSSRILVRNIPFEANATDVKDLFTVFGSLRSVRLPKKAILQAVGAVSGRSGGGRTANLHRGFGFVDFHSVDDAKRAFDALRHSTHLYGRRLVLEWAKTDEAELVEELRAKAAERAMASETARSGAVHAGAVKRLRKADVIASVEEMAKKAENDDDDAIE